MGERQEKERRGERKEEVIEKEKNRGKERGSDGKTKRGEGRKKVTEKREEERNREGSDRGKGETE